MKISKRIFLAATVLILIIAVGYLYTDYRAIKVDKRNADEFEKRIASAVQAGDNIFLKEVTPFAWDKFYYFHAYTSPEFMYKKTGANWASSFLGYLFYNDNEKEMLSDEQYSLVFLKNGKVVCHFRGTRNEFVFDIESEDGVEAENSLFRVVNKGSSDILLLVKDFSELAAINQTDEISILTNALINYYGNTNDPLVIYEKTPFEGGTLVLAEKLTDGEHYPDLHFIDYKGRLAYLTRGSYCWTLNYTRFNGYNIFFGLAGVEKRATPQNPVPNLKPVKRLEAMFQGEAVSIVPAENIIEHINPKDKDTRMFKDPKGYILPVKGWKMPYDFSAVLEGGEKLSLSRTAIEYSKEYMPDYLKANKAEIYNSYAFTFTPMLTPAEWKQGYSNGEILLEGKTDSNNNRNALFLRAAGNMLMTHSFIVPQEIRALYLSNNSFRIASFSEGETVKVIYPEKRSLLDCRILKLTAENVQKEIGQDQLSIIKTNESKQLVLPNESGFYLFLMRTVKDIEIQTYTGIFRIDK